MKIFKIIYILLKPTLQKLVSTGPEWSRPKNHRITLRGDNRYSCDGEFRFRRLRELFDLIRRVPGECLNIKCIKLWISFTSKEFFVLLRKLFNVITNIKPMWSLGPSDITLTPIPVRVFTCRCFIIRFKSFYVEIENIFCSVFLDIGNRKILFVRIIIVVEYHILPNFYLLKSNKYMYFTFII